MRTKSIRSAKHRFSISLEFMKKSIFYKKYRKNTINAEKAISFFVYLKGSLIISCTWPWDSEATCFFFTVACFGFKDGLFCPSAVKLSQYINLPVVDFFSVISCWFLTFNPKSLVFWAGSRKGSMFLRFFIFPSSANSHWIFCWKWFPFAFYRWYPHRPRAVKFACLFNKSWPPFPAYQVSFSTKNFTFPWFLTIP